MTDDNGRQNGTTRRGFIRLSACAAICLGVGARSMASSPPRQKGGSRWGHVPGNADRLRTITCPACGHRESRLVPSEATLGRYHCPACLAWLAPAEDEHCVFCAFGDAPCPAMKGKRR